MKVNIEYERKSISWQLFFSIYNAVRSLYLDNLLYLLTCEAGAVVKDADDVLPCGS